MRIENKQLKDFMLDSNMLDKEKMEEVYQEAESQKKQLGTCRS